MNLIDRFLLNLLIPNILIDLTLTNMPEKQITFALTVACEEI